jgi:hypothetical protein
MNMNNSGFYNPSEVFHMYWVYCRDDRTAMRYANTDGKWMMFIRKEEIDNKWREACDLYRAGRLYGINCMKVSTAKPNPQAIYSEGYGIIIFYCGPSEDRENCMSYGRNILNSMFYNDEYFYYKSDIPHLINYSNKYKHLYFINTFSHYGRGQASAPAAAPALPAPTPVAPAYSQPTLSAQSRTLSYKSFNPYLEDETTSTAEFYDARTPAPSRLSMDNNDFALPFARTESVDSSYNKYPLARGYNYFPSSSTSTANKSVYYHNANKYVLPVTYNSLQQYSYGAKSIYSLPYTYYPN